MTFESYFSITNKEGTFIHLVFIGIRLYRSSRLWITHKKCAAGEAPSKRRKAWDRVITAAPFTVVGVLWGLKLKWTWERSHSCRSNRMW
jgi:hypothetical protein